MADFSSVESVRDATTIGRMTDFDNLRKLARDKRDKAIKLARHEYHVTLDEITVLQKRLTRKPSLKGRPKPQDWHHGR